ISSEIFQALKQQIAATGSTTAVGDEGGFTFKVVANTQMLDLLDEAVETAGYDPNHDVGYAMDVAASEFFDENEYHLKSENRSLATDEMIEYLERISKTYNVVSIEDGLDQDSWADWQTLTKRLKSLQLVGDDLLVTNITRLAKAIKEQAGNAILIKPNQIGTLSETIKAVGLAKENGWNSIISHRSGETEDVTISHLAIGTGAGQIKTGSLSRGERTSKHNEIIRLEEIDPSIKLANPFIQ
ncbi:MAG: phosphopyruvate hydratase, partial [Candidatus Saccharimonadales bacterium]|nr:phosphopyruvate hydratase [Candidatus Saccharimonadales bacterium]